MSRELAIQTACLYGPIVFVLLLVAARRPTRRQALGALFGLLWVAALLPWLDRLCRGLAAGTTAPAARSLAACR